MPDVISWLLEEENPAVQYRTKTELLGEPADNEKVLKWIDTVLPEEWYERNGLWYRYYITALAECGLTCDDIKIGYVEKAFHELSNSIDCNCGDFMLLRSLVKMGYGDGELIKQITGKLCMHMLPDHGFLCLHRVNKLKYTPKSCYKDNLHALLFLSECSKKGIVCGIEKELTDYFYKHDIFYKSTDKSTLVLYSREGWRTIDTFYPFEVMRVGLQNVIEAFCALGYGNDERLKSAWDILYSKREKDGRYVLNGTLSKSYLPKERVGKPSKWITFYALLAEKEKQLCSK